MSFILFALVILLNSGYAHADVAAPINPHNFDNKEFCQTCHIVAEMPKLNHDPVTTCVKCHPGSIGNHPVSRHPILARVPHKIVPPDWMPLSVEEKIVCYTCHDNHNKSGFNRMLRIDYEALCTSCHVDK